MDKIYDITEKILHEFIIKLRTECSNIEISHQKELSLLNKKNATLTEVNSELISVNNNKDKMLHLKDKTIHDYEIQINSLSNEQKEEISSREKVSMFVQKDKLVAELQEENERLKNRITMLEKKDKGKKINEIVEEIETNTETQTQNNEDNNIIEDNNNEDNVEESQNNDMNEGDVTDVEDDIEDDNPIVVFIYKDVDYCYDSSKKIDSYYHYDDDNDCIGEKVSTLKYISKNQHFVIEDTEDKKKYILEMVDGMPGNVIGYKDGKKSKLY